MKIKELLPDQLMTAVKNTVKGTLTEADRNYIKQKCGFTIEQLYYCDDGSFELEVAGPQGTQTLDISDLNTFENDWVLTNYHSVVFMQLLHEISCELPEWAYDESQFVFNWSALGEESLEQFTEAFDEVWDMVFDGKRTAWRTGREPMTRLEELILDQMFGVEVSDGGWSSEKTTEWNVLPDWLRDCDAPLKINVDLMRRLEEFAQGLLEPEALQETETYVSPFTGRPA